MEFNVIAIEREYASGGREVGEKLAERLGIPCYGREILEQAALRLNLPLEQLEEIEEKATGSFLYGLAAFASLTSGQNTDLLTLEQKLAITESDIIKNLASFPCVIIGRGAAAFLKDKGNAFKVFVHADYNTRKDRAINIYGIDPKQAESVLHRYDKRRANYFKTVTDTAWKDADMYHLYLNSAKLDISTIVDIIYYAVK